MESAKYKRLDLIDQKKALDLQIEKISYQIDKDHIFADYAIFEKIETLKKLCDQGNLESSEKLAASIHLALKRSNVVRIERNELEKVAEYQKQPSPNVFPNSFNLHGIEIMRGINIGLGSLPGIGKTTTACNIAYYNIMNKKKTLFISMEMTIPQIFIKLYLMYLANYHKRKLNFIIMNDIVRNPEINKLEYDKFIEFVKRTHDYLIVVDDDKLTPSQICYLCDEAKKEFNAPLDWVIVDYIQRVRPEDIRTQTMREKMIMISDLFTLKAKADLLNILLLSQLNDKGAYMEASNIQQDVGMALKLSRELDDNDEYKPEIEIRIDKSRFTRLAKSIVPFDGGTGVIG